MQYRTLGRTGVQVSSLALGAMNFGKIGRTTQGEAARRDRRDRRSRHRPRRTREARHPARAARPITAAPLIVRKFRILPEACSA
jgi:aryl-alcohol dehydrogenase-like predicted oxidoreductase